MSEAITDADGTKYIPATQRPDGSWRKPRRVRDGYVPQEEVPLYESKGKQFAARNATGIPVGLTAEIVAEAKAKAKKEAKNSKCPIPGLIIQTDESNKKKKNKNSDIVEITSAANKISLSSSKNEPTADPAKRLKNLRKKLRETEVLEAKIKSGELPNPEKEQLEKVKNKQSTIEEIAKLEAML